MDAVIDRTGPTGMQFGYTETQQEVREAIRRLCAEYGPAYWRGCDERSEYPEAFVQAMTDAGWLAALIPEEYGGYGVASEYDVERKWKEARLFKTAPISNNLVLAQHAQHTLKMPRSY